MIAQSLRSLDQSLRRFRPYIAKLRYSLLAWRFVVAGKGGSLGAQVRLLGNADVRLGDRVALRRGVTIGGNGRLTIGSGTCINENSILTVMESITIGRDVMIAPNVMILDVDHRFGALDRPINRQGYSIAPVVIEDDVWIGVQCVITKGVRIGQGAVVGANSLVTRDVPSNTVVGGVPAKVLKARSACNI